MNAEKERKSVDEATPAEWDALHRQEAEDSGIKDDNLSPAQKAYLDQVCFECG